MAHLRTTKLNTIKLNTTKHAAYDLTYHIVLTVKYRHDILTGDLARFTQTEIENVCARYGWPLLALAVRPDHVHLLVSVSPATPPVRVTATVKSLVTVAVFRRFGLLKGHYFRRSGLFSRGCYYGAVGNADRETVTNYIQRQAP